MKIRSELWCHDCDNYVQFTLDDELNGNHLIKCPKCGHEHCRVIKDGKVTSDRWDSRNGQRQQIFYAANISYSSSSTEITYDSNTTTTGGSSYLYSSWSNSQWTAG